MNLLLKENAYGVKTCIPHRGFLSIVLHQTVKIIPRRGFLLIEKNKGAPDGAPYCGFYTKKNGLEVIVDTKAEAQETVEGKIIEVGTKIEVVAAFVYLSSIGSGRGGEVLAVVLPAVGEIDTQQIEVQISREILVELVVHTRNDVDSDATLFGPAFAF